ncbi:MAG: T9SS type A sorting domain-containing protein, partial [Ignavibacteria bacterium]|nr:T9SS type A sorting domain-containing protein [Ignavibacteria bacterium]
ALGPFTGFATETDFNNPDRILWGFNWGGTNSRLNRLLGFNYFHGGDSFCDTAKGANLLPMDAGGMRLISTVNNITYDREGDQISWADGESMEWQPWLEWDTTSTGDSAILNVNDTTGGVFGFRTMNFGELKRGTDSLYRLHITRTMQQADTNTIIAFEAPEKDNAIMRQTRLKDLFTGPDAKYTKYGDQNTNRMLLAVNLRRDGGTYANDSIHAPDVVLRIRLHYELGDSSTWSAGDITFNRVPEPTDTAVMIVNNGLARGLRLRDSIVTIPRLDYFDITRGMIPAGNDDVTIYAEFLCNRFINPDTTKLSNNGVQNNPPFPDFIASEPNQPNRIRHLNMSVEYMDDPDAVGVEVRYLRLETPAARDLLWGERDSAINVEINAYLTALQEYNRLHHSPDNTIININTDSSARLHRIYGRDEIHFQNWRAMRYMNRLLRENNSLPTGFVTTEWSIQEYWKAKQCLMLRTFWEGTTVNWHNKNASPTVKKGYTGFDSEDYAGIGSGILLHSNFETISSVFFSGSWHTPSSLPITSDLEEFISVYAVGTQPTLQWYLDHVTKKELGCRYLFDPEIHWTANVWNYSQSFPSTDSSNYTSAPGGLPPVGERSVEFANARPKSVGELRLQSWLPIVLGAKGLIYYNSNTHTFPNVNDVGYWNGTKTLSKEGREFGFANDASVPWNVSPFNATTPSGIDSSFESDGIGGDYVKSGDTSRFDTYCRNGIDSVATKLNDGTPSDSIFVGRKTQRQIAREVTSRLMPHSVELANIHLVSWFSRGYRGAQMQGDSLRFDSLFNVSRLVVFKPYEAPITITTPPYMARQAENNDSVFCDITLFAHKTKRYPDTFYVGVCNRRTDTRIALDTPTTAYDEFRTTVDSFPDRLYTQLGSRSITIPFSVTKNYSDYRMLRVTELSAAETDTTRYGLKTGVVDTIIGQDKDLLVTLLPGEGKMFRVTVIAPVQTEPIVGFLDHSNQRKLIAFPEIATARSRVSDITPDSSVVEHEIPMVEMGSWTQYIPDDTMRYHMVYHRAVATDGNNLHVFYRRSYPMLFDGTENDSANVPRSILRSPNVKWEPEIDLNVNIRVRTPIDSIGSAVTGISGCAYPSIVVRPQHDGDTSTWSDGNAPPAGKDNYVYVTYTCKECPNSIWTTDIIYRKFPADLDTTLQRAYINNTLKGAWVIDRFPIPQANIQVQLDSAMHKWGTPVINASASGNFLAWSHPTLGIRTVHYAPTLIQPMLYTNVTQVKVSDDQDVVATHPSLNTYSRLNLGERDAGLVWQEGLSSETGNAIYYTRLFSNGGVVDYRLAVNFDEIQDSVNVALPNVKDGAVLRLTQLTDQVSHDPGLEVFGRTHRYPTIMRHLSDYDIDSANSRFIIGLVNTKAERVFWETKAVYVEYSGEPLVAYYTTGKNEIARKAFDIVDKGARYPDSIPVISGNGPHLLWSENRGLFGPNIAQGELVSENYPGVANPTEFWSEDSVNVLNFFTRTAAQPGTIWQLPFGYHYYGSLVHHEMEYLGKLQEVSALGTFPQQAARFSMHFHPGWQRNRRIQEGDSPQRDTALHYTQIPFITANAQHFYKNFDNNNVALIEYTGWRDPEGRSFRVSGFLQDGSTMKFTAAKKGEAAGTTFYTEKSRSFSIEEFAFSSHVDPGFTGASLSVKRASDGMEVEIQLDNSQKNGRTTDYLMKAISASDEQYIFKLSTIRDDMLEIHDHLMEDQGDVKFKREFRGTLVRELILDGKSMRILSSANPELLVYPNPATTSITISCVIPFKGGSKQIPEVELSLLSLQGELLMRSTVSSVSTTNFDVSNLPQGLYLIKGSYSPAMAPVVATFIKLD